MALLFADRLLKLLLTQLSSLYDFFSTKSKPLPVVVDTQRPRQGGHLITSVNGADGDIV